ncbi:hypothetical protein GOODEAATRI_034081 [Goodea atripinnis]|uniref:Uncharacterized protein n=1 Tax=Goodea atripinnis TaxID=208336 RepID=A0ABV0NFZ9_9TELE
MLGHKPFTLSEQMYKTSRKSLSIASFMFIFNILWKTIRTTSRKCANVELNRCCIRYMCMSLTDLPVTCVAHPSAFCGESVNDDGESEVVLQSGLRLSVMVRSHRMRILQIFRLICVLLLA